MEFRLTLRSPELDPERLHVSTIELQRTIIEETEGSVSTPSVAAAAGDKGDPITVGSLLVTFLTSGAAVSIFKVLEAYVTRKRSLHIEIARPDGQKFVLQAEDVSPKEVAETQKAFAKFIK